MELVYFFDKRHTNKGIEIKKINQILTHLSAMLSQYIGTRFLHKMSYSIYTSLNLKVKRQKISLLPFSIKVGIN